MDRKTTFLAVLAGLTLTASATLAFAGDRGGHYVWRTEHCGCVVHVRHFVRHVRHIERVQVRYVAPLPPPPPVVEREVEVVDNSVSLPGGFFADSGGVGPAFVDFGGGGGGGVVIAQGSAFAGARASASANISIAFRGGGHMRPMHMMHGCGCGGHKW